MGEALGAEDRESRMGPSAHAGRLSSGSSVHRSQHTPYFLIPSPFGPRCIRLLVRAVHTGVRVEEWLVLSYTRGEGDHLGEHPSQQHIVPSPTEGCSHGISSTKVCITFSHWAAGKSQERETQTQQRILIRGGTGESKWKRTIEKTQIMF